MTRGVSISIRIMSSIFCEISGLRKLIFYFEVNFPFGVGVLGERFIDSIFKVELFFPFEEVKNSLVVSYLISITPGLSCRLAHNDIILKFYY